jgi:CheY-like chemotaxis protein
MAMVHILIVDDDETMTIFLRSIVDFLQWTSMTAKNMPEALQLLGTSGSQFDVVISDYLLGSLGNGLDLLEKMKDIPKYSSIPFVLAHGGDRIKASQAKEAGCSAFLVKPFKVDEVTGTLKSVLNI